MAILHFNQSQTFMYYLLLPVRTSQSNVEDKIQTVTVWKMLWEGWSTYYKNTEDRQPLPGLWENNKKNNNFHHILLRTDFGSGLIPMLYVFYLT